MIELIKGINIKEIPKNKNPKKVVSIVEKMLNFDELQKGKGLKLLTPKQTPQRLPIALAQVKAGSTFESLLNEICRIFFVLGK